MNDIANMDAATIAQFVHAGTISARQSVEAVLRRISERNEALGALTDIISERALAKADALDAARAHGKILGPLAGVPFVAKNLFDIEGLPTRAGSRINRSNPPATSDAKLIQNLEAAGAILVGAANMGEYAYDFTGENIHDGPSRNPHDPLHMSGGSSGGSAGAVASGMVPLSLGSDTNGSIRVPSAFCGLFGLKPTYGRLSRSGTFPFVASFDHLGPFARSVADLALAYDAMVGLDPTDPAQAHIAPAPTCLKLDDGLDGLRIARLGGYFSKMGEAEVFAAVDRVAAVLNVERLLEWPQVDAARSSAFLIAMTEGAALHYERLKTRGADFDPDVRDRLLAGTMLPGHWLVRAQKFRRWFQNEVAKSFQTADIVIAPAVPCRAPKLGQKTMVLDGQEMLVRPNLGIFSQPISFIGLPVVTVPVWTDGETLPVGVQIIGAPWREDLVLRVARVLEREGVVHAPIARFGKAN